MNFWTWFDEQNGPIDDPPKVGEMSSRPWVRSGEMGSAEPKDRGPALGGRGGQITCAFARTDIARTGEGSPWAWAPAGESGLRNHGCRARYSRGRPRPRMRLPRIVAGTVPCSTWECPSAAAGYLIPPGSRSPSTLVPGSWCAPCGSRIVAEYREKLREDWRFYLPRPHFPDA